MKRFIFFLAMLCWATSVFAVNYEGIDAYAFKAPQIKSEKDMNVLVEYLTKPYHNDIDKARSIYAWIVQNIDYDAYKAKLLENPRLKGRLAQLPESGHILETRVGVCEDIANLYQEMALRAGLNVQAVDGWTNMDQSRKKKANIGHRWLVIKIADTWEYLDPTWALGETAKPVFSDVYGNVRYKSELRKRMRNKKTYEPRNRMVTDTWFFTDKDEMIKTHFPRQEQWQLQEVKVSEEEFFGKDRHRRKRK